MNSITTAAPAVNGLPADLAADLVADGWEPGWPDHVGADARAVDMQVCRAFRCPDCGRRGMRGQPYHRAGSYRLVAVCGHPGCGHAEEL